MNVACLWHPPLVVLPPAFVGVASLIVVAGVSFSSLTFSFYFQTFYLDLTLSPLVLCSLEKNTKTINTSNKKTCTSYTNVLIHVTVSWDMHVHLPSLGICNTCIWPEVHSLSLTYINIHMAGRPSRLHAQLLTTEQHCRMPGRQDLLPVVLQKILSVEYCRAGVERGTKVNTLLAQNTKRYVSSFWQLHLHL